MQCPCCGYDMKEMEAKEPMEPEMDEETMAKDEVLSELMEAMEGAVDLPSKGAVSVEVVEMKPKKKV